MSLVAAVMLGAAVGLLTTALWPRPSETAPRLEFVEDSTVPRTIH